MFEVLKMSNAFMAIWYHLPVIIRATVNMSILCLFIVVTFRILNGIRS